MKACSRDGLSRNRLRAPSEKVSVGAGAQAVVCESW